MFVKICGITNEEDALVSVALGADAVGFVFAPSLRQMAPQKVRDIARRLPPEVLTVGVFRDEAKERVVETVSQTGLRCAQLHGKETIDDTLWVKERVPYVFKAFSVGDPAAKRADRFAADVILVDGTNPGSGEVFDWELVGEVPIVQRLMLAGGLTPENVAGAINSVHPWGVDVSSGVESQPGRKDPLKLRSFIAAARAASMTAPEVADLEARGDHQGHMGPYDWQEDD